MIDGTILIVIPARGGSKRIPNKNLKTIYGQPMIYWPLMELRKAFKAENILVSTDSSQIISAVKAKGLAVPFVRPENLSDDFTGTVPVVTHALNWYEENIKQVDFVLTVYPTAVLLNIDDIRASFSTLSGDPQCDSIMSATTFPFPIQRAVYESGDGYAEMFEPRNYHERSQDLVEAKHDAGQFYLSRAAAVRRGAILTDSKVKLCLLHRSSVVDIDVMEDFELAEDRLKSIKQDLVSDSWTF